MIYDKSIMSQYFIFRSLKNALSVSYPNDLLMPVDKNTKRPKFQHKDNAWTKECLDKFLECNMSNKFDWCIILKNLCVIDFDDAALADEYEMRFPELLNAPMEVTSRGRHYWFVRPDFADVDGYYDGAGQREPKVDFKSVHSTGTGGIVVVGPSTNKTWIRPLWSVHASEMSRELLHAVAVPKNVKITRELKFYDGIHLVEECKWIPQMEYFEPMDDIDDMFCVPCNYDDFKKLMHVLDHDMLWAEHVTKFEYYDIVALADKLGLRKMHTIKFGNARQQLDMCIQCPEWWATIYEEKKWRIGGAGSNDILVDIDTIVDTVKFVPMSTNESWLFPARDVQIEKGAHVLSSTCDLPREVLEILEKYPGKIVLAGGAALHDVAVLNYVPSDYDFFFVGVDEQEASSILDDVLSGVPFVRSKCATNFLVNGMTLQFVHRLHDNAAQVVVGFDNHPCKVVIWHTGERVVRMCAPSFVPAIRHHAFPIDFENWGAASPMRIIKYYAKGFNVFVPMLRRAATKYQDKNRGLTGLLRYECMLTMSGKTVTMKDVEGIAHFLKYDKTCMSDYTILMKVKGSFMGFLRMVYEYGQSIWVRTPERRNVKWYRCNSHLRCMGAFLPQSPCLGCAYDWKKLDLLMYER